MSTIHSIVARLGDHQLVALTQEQFDKWETRRKNEYLKRHPTSKFGSGKGATGGKHDQPHSRLHRSAPSNKPSSEASYTFTSNSGKAHKYKDGKQLARHHAQLSKEFDNALSSAKSARTKSESHAHQATLRDLHDHLSGLERLAGNQTYQQDHGNTGIHMPVQHEGRRVSPETARNAKYQSLRHATGPINREPSTPVRKSASSVRSPKPTRTTTPSGRTSKGSR